MKKQQPFSIEIPKPCGENRDLMERTENGWFCNVCQQEVLDFRDKSDAALREAFRNPGAQPCGVFRPDQVARPTPGRSSCSAYSNTWKAISLVLAGTLALEGCFMGKRMDPETDRQQEQIGLKSEMPVDTVFNR